MVLFDLVGDCDLQVPREAGSSRRLYDRFAEAARAAHPEEGSTPFVGEAPPVLDDHSPFLDAGIPAVDLIDFTYGPGPSPGGLWHTPEGTLDKVCADSLGAVGEADDLERAVTNLLDNAVKWSPPGGTIRVHLEGDRLRVADQGQGIAEADLPYVFDRFYRGEAARPTPGTGLGLSIVGQTVQRHGGWVRAGRSAQGGAEFTIRLPGATTIEELETNGDAADAGALSPSTSSAGVRSLGPGA